MPDSSGRSLRWSISSFDVDQRKTLASVQPFRRVDVNLSVAEVGLASELTAAIADTDCVVSDNACSLIGRFEVAPRSGPPVPPRQDE